MKAKSMFSMYGVVQAMGAPCGQLGNPSARKWIGKNTRQQEYVSACARMADMKAVPGTAQMAKVKGNDVFLESVLDARVQWLKRGVKCDLDCGPGVELTEGVTIYQNHIAVAIKTKSGTTVWLSPGHLGKTRVDLHRACRALQIAASTGGATTMKYQGVRFPQVPPTTLKVVLKELLGLGLGAYKCTSATQDLEFEMDVGGARAKAQTQIRMTKSIPKPFFTIDGPFTLFMCQNMDEPFFTATFTR